MLLRKAYEALPPKGALIVHEALIDDARKDERLRPAHESQHAHRDARRIRFHRCRLPEVDESKPVSSEPKSSRLAGPDGMVWDSSKRQRPSGPSSERRTPVDMQRDPRGGVWRTDDGSTSAPLLSNRRRISSRRASLIASGIRHACLWCGACRRHRGRSDADTRLACPTVWRPVSVRSPGQIGRRLSLTHPVGALARYRDAIVLAF